MISLRTLRRAAPSPARLCANGLRYKSSPTSQDGPSQNHEKVIFSGIQPTGVPHLGNYLGALRQWVELQNTSTPGTTLLYSIVDLHAITMKQDPKQLAQSRKEMMASLLAVGLDPSKCIIFAQSEVKQHAELMWILSCGASMGYLGRMTQWKSKLALPHDANPLQPSDTKKAALKLGLFSYPVLQAADILLYNTTHVPVGEDQSQHLELTREVAIGFNHLYSKDSKNVPILTIPQTMLSPAKRVMSLTDPIKKMSKSDVDPKSRILISDSKEVIAKKIKAALTDSIDGISYDRKTRPGVTNLLDLIYYFNPGSAPSPEALAEDMKGISLRSLKETAAETVEWGFRDIREQYLELIGANDKELSIQAKIGAGRAEKIAEQTMKRVRRAMGLDWDV